MKSAHAILAPVVGVPPLPDGGVYNINGGWIDNIGPNGQLRYAFQAPSANRRIPEGQSCFADKSRRQHRRATPSAREDVMCRLAWSGGEGGRSSASNGGVGARG
jgi:hypothetical protein